MLEFITGHAADLIICIVLALLFFLAIRFLVKKKGNACGCGGGCAGCSAGSSGCSAGAGADGVSGCAHCGTMDLPGLDELRDAQMRQEQMRQVGANHHD